MKKLVVALLCLTGASQFKACFFGTLAKIQKDEAKEDETKKVSIKDETEKVSEESGSCLGSYNFLATLLSLQRFENSRGKMMDGGEMVKLDPIIPVIIDGKLQFVKYHPTYQNPPVKPGDIA